MASPMVGITGRRQQVGGLHADGILADAVRARQTSPVASARCANRALSRAGPPTPDVTIHPRLVELTEHLAGTRAELRRVVDAVPAQGRESAPPAGGWSVTEVIDHVAKIEGRVAGLILRAVRAAQASGVGAESDETSILASFPGARVLDRSTKWPAPAIGHPTPGAQFADAVAALEASRGTLLDALRDVDGLALGAVKYPHPAMGELSMYEWIAFLGFHEGRHALQIEEIARALGDTREGA